ncbi:hypothetical protein BpHYR1_001872 [Brachionus plicatilis]|uniref:Uncharacterized protein n=1 Tax=Brachionus plicatilis TaxID=10195 RepID=A0A3M7P7Y7_BRAPC|nr:hypothetical protein BpHYR1_001872 [Brachionus plicatilis]
MLFSSPILFIFKFHYKFKNERFFEKKAKIKKIKKKIQEKKEIKLRFFILQSCIAFLLNVMVNFQDNLLLSPLRPDEHLSGKIVAIGAAIHKSISYDQLGAR